MPTGRGYCFGHRQRRYTNAAATERRGCGKQKRDAREAAVLYTSGTTGNPKGCVLPNAYFLLAGRWYAELGGMASLSEDGERTSGWARCGTFCGGLFIDRVEVRWDDV